MTDICQGEPVSDRQSFGDESGANASRIEGDACTSGSLGMPLVSWDALLERFDGDLELIREVVDVFEPDYRLHLIQLHQAIRTKEAPLLERLAHSLRGSVGNFESPTGVALLLELEQRAASEDLSNAQALVGAIEHTVEALLAELKGHLA